MNIFSSTIVMEIERVRPMGKLPKVRVTNKVRLPRLKLLPNIKSMSGDAIDIIPVDYDWTDHQIGEDWEFSEAVRCEGCNKVIVLGSGFTGDETHIEYIRESQSSQEIDFDDDEDEKCKGYIPEASGPMMSYYYPCPIRDLEKAAKAIVDLPLCVVKIDDQPGFALTGGGMDLTWYICEAFMLAGFLPPLHFAGSLPRMCEDYTARKRWVMSGCRATLAVMKKRVDYKLEDLKAIEKWYLDREKKTA
jgi:hypothetical protein